MDKMNPRAFAIYMTFAILMAAAISAGGPYVAVLSVLLIAFTLYSIR